MNKLSDLLKYMKAIVNPGPSDSKAFSLNLTDIRKFVRNALFVGAGAAVYYLNEKFKTIDFGIYGPLVIPFVAGIFDVVAKFLKGNVVEENKTDETK